MIYTLSASRGTGYLQSPCPVFSHEPVYRLAVIKGFTTGKPYAVANARGKQFVTDQYVRAAHGKSAREWPFIMCSDSAITEAEWERYKKTLNEIV